ncbi:hypothetical protein ABZW18_19115 [Streptomyces sp. NPDC004647]|uniref:hypothetical protein n=1 Tax=Streptomyces sp. NPDC004647 TaxID=3154671 RepID=UPI0033ACF892
MGRELALAVIAHGDRVVATARDVSTVADLVTPAPRRVRAVRLDGSGEHQVAVLNAVMVLTDGPTVKTSRCRAPMPRAGTHARARTPAPTCPRPEPAPMPGPCAPEPAPAAEAPCRRGWETESRTASRTASRTGLVRGSYGARTGLVRGSYGARTGLVRGPVTALGQRR